MGAALEVAVATYKANTVVVVAVVVPDITMAALD
jgi:hypothetical protein